MDFLVHHLLRHSAALAPEKVAVADKSHELTYRSAWSEAQQLALMLRQHGIATHDRVGIYLPPSIHHWLAVFGCSIAGAVFVPIHESRRTHQVAHVVDDCGVHTLITSHRKWLEIRASATNWNSLRTIVLIDGPPQPGDDRDGAPVDTSPAAIVGSPPIVTRWSRSQKDLPTEFVLDESIIESDLAAILYTSGSTGPPKGVMLSHRNVMAGASIVSQYLNITRQDRILAVLPFSFDAGLNQMTTAAQHQATLVIQPFVFAKQIVSALLQYRITALAGVPTFWNLLTDSKAFCTGEFPELRYITNTGGALPRRTLDQLRRTLTDTKIFLMYGLTEAFRSTYLPPDQLDQRPDSIGRAIPNTELMVINQQGELCSPGEVGELVHRGPTVTLGYWENDQQTRAYLRPDPIRRPGTPVCQPVCYSGDLVRQDEAGYFYFVSRRDHQIKSAGFRVSPNEIEEMLLQLTQIRAAAVIGIPDPLLGESIEAWIVPSADSMFVSADEATYVDHVRNEMALRLPSYMVPKSYRITDELPKTSSGKINYGRLKQISAEARPS